MLYIRSAVFFLVMVVSVVLYTPVCILAWPLEPRRRYHVIGLWARFMVWWLKVTCNLRHEVTGLENLPDTPHVVLSKHQSAWETIAFQTIFPPQAWVLKKELLQVPFFGWGLAATGPIAIDRSKGVKALDVVVKEGRKRLAEGRSVLVFPEGHRMAPGEAGKYNPGGAMLAVRTQVPVVPVAHNAGLFWRRRGFVKLPGVVQVVIGPPIDSAGKKARQINDEVQSWIESTCHELG